MKLKISAKNFALALKFHLITRGTNKVHKDSCFHLLMGLEISKVAKKRHRIELCIPLIQSVYVFMCLNHHVAEFQIYNLSSVISGMIVTVKSLLDLLKVQESM